MRILFVTAYYPPADYGWGYMQICEAVADGLAARGHQVAVLTSTYRHGPELPRPYPVHRMLEIDPDYHGGKSAAWQFFVGRRQRQRQAIRDLERLVTEYRPDCIFVWHAAGLPRVILQAAEGIRPTVYYLAGYLPESPDEYVAYWQAEPVSRSAKLFKRPLARLALAMLEREGKPIALRWEYVICVSNYVRQRLLQQKLIPEQSVVAHNGVDLSVFAPTAPRRQLAPANGIRCLVAGRLEPDKGIHTLIDAFSLLGEGCSSLRLDILGDGPQAYLEELRSQVAAHKLQDVITFHPTVPHSEMPRTLERHDVLLLPSEYEEPLACSMLEAMAMDLLVIGTTTGGSGEVLVHEQTGLVFEARNPRSLAAQLGRLVADPNGAARLASAGQKMVREHFTIDVTVDKIERYLARLGTD